MREFLLISAILAQNFTENDHLNCSISENKIAQQMMESPTIQMIQIFTITLAYTFTSM